MRADIITSARLLKCAADFEGPQSCSQLVTGNISLNIPLSESFGNWRQGQQPNTACLTCPGKQVLGEGGNFLPQSVHILPVKRVGGPRRI